VVTPTGVIPCWRDSPRDPLIRKHRPKCVVSVNCQRQTTQKKILRATLEQSPPNWSPTTRESVRRNSGFVEVLLEDMCPYVAVLALISPEVPKPVSRELTPAGTSAHSRQTVKVGYFRVAIRQLTIDLGLIVCLTKWVAKPCTDPSELASNRARRKCYASCRRSRYEQFVAGQRRSTTSARNRIKCS
jgi:hypothetical protein